MADESRTIQTIRENIKKELKEQYPVREIDAMTDILFNRRLHLKKHEVGLKRNEILAQKDQQWFDRAIRKLKACYPVQYITGQAEFYGLVLDVTPDVLIPRPETEELVRWIIDGIPNPRPLIMDMGTGSGCIALALKYIYPQSKVAGLDTSQTALACAKENSRILQMEIDWIQGNILDETHIYPEKKYDLIVSNPPYVMDSEKKMMEKNVLGPKQDLESIPLAEEFRHYSPPWAGFDIRR